MKKLFLVITSIITLTIGSKALAYTNNTLLDNLTLNEATELISDTNTSKESFDNYNEIHNQNSEKTVSDYEKFMTTKLKDIDVKTYNDLINNSFEKTTKKFIAKNQTMNYYQAQEAIEKKVNTLTTIQITSLIIFIVSCLGFMIVLQYRNRTIAISVFTVLIVLSGISIVYTSIVY